MLVANLVGGCTQACSQGTGRRCWWLTQCRLKLMGGCTLTRDGRQVLVVDPVERFTAAQCLEHEWVRRAGEASAKKLHR